MPLLAIFAPIIQFFFREVAVKFLILTAVFAVLTVVIPKAIEYLGPYLGTTSLTSAFNGLGAGTWFFLDFFALGYGLPLVISAAITRFLIRRLPFIG